MGRLEATGTPVGEPFGDVDGEPVELYRLRNANGVEARVTNYGGIIVSLMVPDRTGEFADVVLGYETVDEYVADNSPYFGAIIGRFGNRIAGAEFTLDGETHTLAANNGPNALHGGPDGFHTKVWAAEPFSREGAQGLIFTYTSPAGEEGYPGTLEATVTYTLNDENELIFDYHAVSDEATPVNLTQHSYFNLAGHGGGTILDHEVMIAAEHFTPVDSTLIPTGEMRPVEGTPFDFTEPKAIGREIEAGSEQIRFGLGYDHNLVLRRDGPAEEPRLAARVTERESGRVMEIETTEPGLQFYSGNFLDGTITGKDGVMYEHRTGFAMETQHFPDSPNQPSFPSTILRPGEEYESRTIYRFTITEGQ
ncbi:MAG: aldose epimerase family protein [Gemmatimonadota bacterium]